MVRSRVSALVLSVIALAGTTPGAAQSCHSSVAEYPSDAQVEAVRERISSFSATEGDEWAGDYGSSDNMTTGTTLRWSPDAGFVLWREGCYPIPTNASYGAAELRDRRLVLSPEMPLGNRCSYGVANAFVAVRWGARHYLVPEDMLREFCFEVNAFGDEAPSFLVKIADLEKPVRGRPDVPSGSAGFLLERPISARVASAVEGSEREVILDRGSADGLLEGMWLGGTRRGNSVEVHVIAVDARSARARIGGYLTTGDFSGKPDEIVDWKLSTRFEPSWH